MRHLFVCLFSCFSAAALCEIMKNILDFTSMWDLYAQRSTGPYLNDSFSPFWTTAKVLFYSFQQVWLTKFSSQYILFDSILLLDFFIYICVITGFGAFVDKTVLPYTNTNEEKLKKPCDENESQCQAAFGYRHVLSMTPSRETFTQKVTEQFISGNLDSPEGSLDAMMQAAVCGVRTPSKSAQSFTIW